MNYRSGSVQNCFWVRTQTGVRQLVIYALGNVKTRSLMQGVQCNMANCRQTHFKPHHTYIAILYFNYLPKIANCSMNDEFCQTIGDVNCDGNLWCSLTGQIDIKDRFKYFTNTTT